MANWGEMMGEAFSKSFEGAKDRGMKEIEYKKMFGEFLLKKQAEERRQTLTTAMLENIGYKNKVLAGLFGGEGSGTGGMGNGGNFPPGTQFSVGGLTMPLNRKYTEGESKTLSQSDAILADLSELKNMFSGGNKKKATWGSQLAGGAAIGVNNLPFVGDKLAGMVMGISGMGKGGENRQNYTDLQRNIANRLLYLRSGAQINEQEYKRFMAQLPALMRNDKLDQKQLSRFIKEFEGIQGRIKTGAKWDEKAKTFVGGEDTSKKNTISLDALFEGLDSLKEEE